MEDFSGGKYETFRYDQTESSKITQVDSKKRWGYVPNRFRCIFILKAEDKWEMEVLVSANETIQIIDTKKRE
jgi:hypothetical protein